MDKHKEAIDTPQVAPQQPSRIETIGRTLFLVAGGVLLSVLVSCACGPTR